MTHLGLRLGIPNVFCAYVLQRRRLGYSRSAIFVTHFLHPPFSDHVDSEGNLQVETIVQTLARMFRQDMLHTTSDTTHLVGNHIVAAYKKPNYRFAEDGSFDLWLNRYGQ